MINKKIDNYNLMPALGISPGAFHSIKRRHLDVAAIIEIIGSYPESLSDFNGLHFEVAYRKRILEIPKNRRVKNCGKFLNLLIFENLIFVQEHLYVILSVNTIFLTYVDLLKSAYSRPAPGNVKTEFAAFDPAIVYQECNGMPFPKGVGIFKGQEAIMKNSFIKLPG